MITNQITHDCVKPKTHLHLMNTKKEIGRTSGVCIIYSHLAVGEQNSGDTGRGRKGQRDTLLPNLLQVKWTREHPQDDSATPALLMTGCGHSRSMWLINKHKNSTFWGHSSKVSVFLYSFCVLVQFLCSCTASVFLYSFCVLVFVRSWSSKDINTISSTFSCFWREASDCLRDTSTWDMSVVQVEIRSRWWAQQVQIGTSRYENELVLTQS